MWVLMMLTAGGKFPALAMATAEFYSHEACQKAAVAFASKVRQTAIIEYGCYEKGSQE